MTKHFMCGFALVCTILHCVMAQRPFAAIPGLSPDDGNKLCVVRSEMENALINFRFIKADGITFLRVGVKDLQGLQKMLPEECWYPGAVVNWKIHERALFGGFGLGHEACSPDNVGGDWDPTMACSPSSGNEFCTLFHIPSSSVLGSNGAYQCTPEMYQQNQYSCVVGDFSNKYGQIRIPDFEQYPEHSIVLYMEDTHDTLHTCDLSRKSLVVSCADGKHAMCVKLQAQPRKAGEIEGTFFFLAKEIKDYRDYLTKPEYPY